MFASNLRDLLLAAPAGTRATHGPRPGPAHRREGRRRRRHRQGRRHRHDLPARARRDVGRARSRRSTRLAARPRRRARSRSATAPPRARPTSSPRELVARNPALGLDQGRSCREAGASVYSASAYASAELPDLDVSLRGAVSIARRLQDPLAELVKIDPKSIGVGQYQHDVPESALSRSLDAVVEDCVNAVGVDLNTASAPLLRAGVGHHRVARRADRRAPRRQRPVPHPHRAGRRAAPGPQGVRAVRGLPAHPRRRRPARRLRRAPGGLPGGAPHPGPREAPTSARSSATRRSCESLAPQRVRRRAFGLPTVTDILAELEKPGRDPRPAFRTATFAEGVHKLADLQPGMVLEGQVTNVAAFGAFVDVGVHQDGLVHVSAMSATFVVRPARGREVRRRRAGQGPRRRRGRASGSRSPCGWTTRSSAGSASPNAGRAGTAGNGVRARRPEAGGARPPRHPRPARATGRSVRGAANSAMADALRRAGLTGK